MMQIGQISSLVKEAAHNAGFELAGIAPVHEFEELDRFREWIDAGRAGEMHYMEARNESGALKRASLRARCRGSEVSSFVRSTTTPLILTRSRRTIPSGDGSPATLGDSRIITTRY